MMNDNPVCSPRMRANKGRVSELTRRLDRGILKAMDHAETDGARTEPSERRNEVRAIRKRPGNRPEARDRTGVFLHENAVGSRNRRVLLSASCLSQPVGEVRKQGSGGV